jgi:hypothetical protein
MDLWLQRGLSIDCEGGDIPPAFVQYVMIHFACSIATALYPNATLP